MCKKIIILALLGFVVFMTLAGSVNTPSRWEPYIEGVLEYIKCLQDSEYEGESLALVPMSEKNLTYTTTYQSALAAIALMSEGYYGRARRILDVFKDRPGGDPFSPDTCSEGIPGGYQQHRNAQTGDPLDAPVNDFWIGDNAWLLAALKYYKATASVKVNRYNDLIQQLADWFVAIYGITPYPGIYGGFDKYGCIIDKHPEGSIDVYGVLHGMGTQATQDSIKCWIDENVWIPKEERFIRGPANMYWLPLDHVAWGYLALGDEYESILLYAEELHRRAFDPYLIETFEKDPGPYDNPEEDPRWPIMTPAPPDPVPENVEASREKIGPGYNLVIDYEFGEANAWFLVHRNSDIDLKVNDKLCYSFYLYNSIEKDNAKFHIKVKNDVNQESWVELPLDFTGWKKIDIYNEPCDEPLYEYKYFNTTVTGRIIWIAFGINNGIDENFSGTMKLSTIRYYNEKINMPYKRFYNVFAAFDSDINWLYTDSTCHMATAYAVAGKLNKWKFYVDEMTNILIPPESCNGLGYPCDLHGGRNYPGLVEYDSFIMAPWFVIAARGIDPFPE